MLETTVEFEVVINQPDQENPPIFGSAIVDPSTVTLLQEVPAGNARATMIMASSVQLFTMEPIHSVAARLKGQEVTQSSEPLEQQAQA
jgi:hypothetical protein